MHTSVCLLQFRTVAMQSVIALHLSLSLSLLFSSLPSCTRYYVFAHSSHTTFYCNLIFLYSTSTFWLTISSLLSLVRDGRNTFYRRPTSTSRRSDSLSHSHQGFVLRQKRDTILSLNIGIGRLSSTTWLGDIHSWSLGILFELINRALPRLCKR
jgi:hypothetical protein